MEILQVAIDSAGSVTGANAHVSAVNRMARASALAQGRLVAFDQSLRRLGASFGLVGGGFRTMIAGLGGLAVMRSATKTLADFQDIMATVGAVTQANTKQFKALEAQAKQLGATTKFTATQAGEGLLFLARAGFTVNEAMTALPHTLNLATAGALDLGQAADIASNILSQFNLEAEQTERVVDTLVAVSNNSNTSVQQLAEAMTYAGATAGAMGIEVEKAAAAIGVLGDFGIQGSMAGTNLRGVIAGLMGQTDSARAAIRSMGLTMADVNPVTNDLADIFEKLEDNMFDASAAFSLFGRRNVAAALAMMASSDRIRELNELAKESTGLARRQAEVMADTLGGALRSLKSAWEGLMLSVGDRGFAGAMRTAVDTMTGAIRILAGMGEMVEENRAAAMRLAQGFVIIGKVLVGVLALKVVGWLAGVAAGLYGVAKAALVAAAALSGPLVVAIATLGAALAAFELGSWLYDEFRVIQTGVDSIVAYFRVGWNEVKRGTEIFVEQLKTAWEDTMNWLTRRFKVWITSVISGMGAIPGISNQMVSGMKAAAAALMPNYTPREGTIADRVKEINERYTAQGKEIIKETAAIMKGIADEFEKPGRTGQSFTDRMAEDILAAVDVAKGGVKLLQKEFGNLMDSALIDEWMASLSGINWESLSANADGELSKIQDRMTNIVDKLNEIPAATVAGIAAFNRLGGSVQGDIDRILLSDPSIAKNLMRQQAAHELGQTVLGSDKQKALLEDFDKLLRQRDQLSRMADVSRDFGSAFEDAAMTIVDSADNARKAIQDLGKAMYQSLVRNMFMKPGAEALQGLTMGLAKSIIGAEISTAPSGGGGGGGSLGYDYGAMSIGGAAARGAVIRMGSGGIAYGPQMAPGGVKIGEQAWEGVLPLQRDSRGRLGVSAAGGGGGQTIINAPVTVVANDPAAFASSKKQLARHMGGVVQQATGRRS